MKTGISGFRERFLKTFLSQDDESDYPEEVHEDYLEIDTEKDVGSKAKIIVRPFVIGDFNDVKPALDSIREGYTIALINIKPLRDKDIVELKRAINKIKKTCDAIEGDIAGFDDNWIVITPSFARIHRSVQTSKIED